MDTPTVKASVLGSGEHRILRYAYERQPRHTTRLGSSRRAASTSRSSASRRESHSRGEKPIHPDLPRCGEIRFTRTPGPAGARSQLRRHDHERGENSPGSRGELRRPARTRAHRGPHETVRRLTDALSVSWAASHAQIRAAVPVDYDVEVTLTDGRRLRFILRSGHDT